MVYLLFSSPLQAQPEANTTNALPKKTDGKPKIGMALSGGGAKGFAQIGVLKILEQEGIRPDMITGTSIGSILGGLYAIGYSVEELEALANSVDWTYYFDDELEREYFPIEERNAAERYQISFPIDNGKVTLPKGLVRGKKISLLLSRLTIPAHGITNFDDFDIPYRGIATDFETGNAIVYGEGDLADVMRASMSLPSIFVPFEIGDKILIDGGVIRNLPVQDAIDLGADKTIAIDIGGPLYDRESFTTLLDVLDQTSSYRIVESNIEQAKLADVIIKPQISAFNALAFGENDTMMSLGRIAALETLPEVKALVGEGEKLPPRSANIPEKVNIVDFEITGCEAKGMKTIANMVQIQTPKIYSLDDLETRFKKLYGSELVALASYRLIPQGDGYKLLLRVQHQNGEYIRLSANYDSRIKSALLLNLTLRNRIFSGSKLNIDLRVAENPGLDIDYYMNTSTRPNVGWHLGGRIHFYPGYNYINNNRGPLLELRHANTEFNIFSTFNNRFLVSTGIGLEQFILGNDFFDFTYNELILNQGFLQLEFLRDTYNKDHFPTEGSFFQLKGKYLFNRNFKVTTNDPNSVAQNNNALARLQMSKAFPIGKKVTPILGADAAWTRLAENNFFNRFYLGRALPFERSHIEFIGLRYMEQPASAYALAQIKVQVEPYAGYFTSLVFNSAYYNLQRIAVNNNTLGATVFNNWDYTHGIGLELGMESRLGPVVFSAEYNLVELRSNFAFHLGHWF